MKEENQDATEGAITPFEPPQELDEIELLKEQIKEEQDKYLRSLADMENARKRMSKERQESTRFAVENVIAEFLTPLDNLENALRFAHLAAEETQMWAKGFEMILAQFKEILSTHQVNAYPSEGQLFNPHLHEVLEVEETEKHEDGRVIQEFAKGYKCGERILRPARVKVAKRPKGAEKPTDLSHYNHQGDQLI